MASQYTQGASEIQREAGMKAEVILQLISFLNMFTSQASQWQGDNCQRLFPKAGIPQLLASQAVNRYISSAFVHF
jgi:hypothetical protein